MKRPTFNGKVALLIAACAAAFSAPLNKIALGQGIHPVWLNAIRLGMALLIMLPYRPKAREERGGGKPTLAVASGVLLAGHLVAWVFALKLIDALAATTIWSTYLFMTAGASVLFLREKLPKGILWPLLLAAVGVVICGSGFSGGNAPGNLAALLCAATYTAYLLCGRVARRRMNTAQYTRIVYTSALGALIITALVLRLPLEGLTLTSISAVFGLAVFATLLGHTLCSYALKTVDATTVSSVMLTEVITGPLMVFLWLGEMPARDTLLGGSVILLAVAWYLVKEKNRSF